jgi:hypothetical protein
MFLVDDDIRFDERHSVYKSQATDNKANTGLTQAKLLDRTFVTRSDVVSVYKTDDDTGMNLEVSIGKEISGFITIFLDKVDLQSSAA